MDFDYSWEAVTKPWATDRYFQFNRSVKLTTAGSQFNYGNALILGELCRLIYRQDEAVYCNDKKISFINTLLNQLELERLEQFENEELLTCAWLLKAKLVGQEEEECLILVFRGTYGFDNWRLNARALHTSHEHEGQVHQGFYEAYRSLEDQILNYTNTGLQGLPIMLAGHSLGGAMATLAMASLLRHKRKINCCYTFGSPKVGDQDFANQFLRENLYRIVNRSDVVARLPIDFINTHYVHAGESHYFNNTEHHIGLPDATIELMQTGDLPRLKELNSLDTLRGFFKNIDGDVPSFLADHAPLNYLARLDQNTV